MGIYDKYPKQLAARLNEAVPMSALSAAKADKNIYLPQPLSCIAVLGSLR